MLVDDKNCKSFFTITKHTNFNRYYIHGKRLPNYIENNDNRQLLINLFLLGGGGGNMADDLALIFLGLQRPPQSELSQIHTYDFFSSLKLLTTFGCDALIYVLLVGSFMYQFLFRDTTFGNKVE